MNKYDEALKENGTVLYKCNPSKNEKCQKTFCAENGGECEMTPSEEFSINGKRYIFDARIGRYTYADRQEKLTLTQALQDMKFFLRTAQEAAPPERVTKKIVEAADKYNDAVNKYEDEVHARAYIQGLQDGMFQERLNIIESLVGELEDQQKKLVADNLVRTAVGFEFAVGALKEMKKTLKEEQECRLNTN